MGNQCVRLCGRPCRTRQNIEQRIESVYLFAPCVVTEAYCRGKALKFWEYLKDRPMKISHSISVFKLIISRPDFLNVETNSLISLLTPRFLAELNIQFLNLAYLAIYRIIKLPFFTNLKLKVYDSINSLSYLYPNEEVSIMEDIIKELFNCLSKPDKITKHEIEFFLRLISGMHSNLTENNSLDWRRIYGLVLDRILYLTEIDAELDLLTAYSGSLFENHFVHKGFFVYILDYLYSNQAWGSKSSAIFEAIIIKNSKYLRIQGPVLLELFLQYIKRHKNTQIKEVTQCILILLENCKEIETFNFSELFEKFIIQFYEVQNVLIQQVLIIWCQKSEILSFFKTFKNFLTKYQQFGPARIVLSQCRKRVKNEIKKKNVRLDFIQKLLDFLYECINLAQKEINSGVLKNLAFLVENTANFVVFNKAEIKALSSVFLIGMQTDENLADFKSFTKLFISIANQKVPEHMLQIFQFLVKIRVNSGKTISFYKGIFLWTLLKLLSRVYKIPKLLKFINSTVDKNLKTEPYRSNILNPEIFSQISSLKISIFTMHSISPGNFPVSLFDFEKLIPEFSNVFDLGDEEDFFLPFNPSDTDYSVSSLQERILETQETKLDLLEIEYGEILLRQEEFDTQLLNQVQGVK